MNILILGCYYCNNIADKLFILAFTQLLHKNKLTFANISEIKNYNLNNYQCLILGAGDLFDSKLTDLYHELTSNLQIYKLAITGFTYQALLDSQYIECFDDILVRNVSDLAQLTKNLGSANVNRIPDLTFMLDRVLLQHSENNNIAFFLTGALKYQKELLQDICNFIDYLLQSDYKINLFTLCVDKDDNDLEINEIITNKLNNTNIIIHQHLTDEQFLTQQLDLQYAFSMRLHGHIYCTRFNIPFLSLNLNRKTKLYVQELPLAAQYNIAIDKNKDIVTIKHDYLLSLFTKLTENRYIVSDLLEQVTCNEEEHFKYNKIKTLVTNQHKRVVHIPRINKNEYYNLYIKHFRNMLKLGINPLTDKLQKYLTKIQIEEISREICYDLTLDTNNDYNYGMNLNLQQNSKYLKDMVKWVHYDQKAKTILPKINLHYLRQDSFNGLHRAGWQYVINGLNAYSNNYGVFLDTYLDRTFGWSSNVLQKDGLLPYTNYWIGFFHHTFDTEYDITNNLTVVFNNKLFHCSLKYCKGIFVLNNILCKQLSQKLRELNYQDIIVESLYHPTIITNNKFTIDNYNNNPNKKLINIGCWYRNPITLHTLAAHTDYQYCMLKGKRMNSNFAPDIINFTFTDDKVVMDDNSWTRYLAREINKQIITRLDSKYCYQELLTLNNGILNIKNASTDLEKYLQQFNNNVTILEHVSDEEYDNLLNSNIIFLNLVTASAVNTIIECIVRNTPVIVNRIIEIEEVLGKEYPMFYDNIDDIHDLLTYDKIIETHYYIKEKIKHDVYKLDYFIDSFVNSDIYRLL